MAPRGSSRADLAAELAARTGGSVRRTLHLDSEPSLVPGSDHFLHLTPGFAVDGPDGPLCELVDDITLAADLDQQAPPRPGWWRLVGTDARLMRLIQRHVDPAAPLEAVLEPVAELFGTVVERIGGAVRVDDAAGATVVLGVPLPGERERPCEVVTTPIAAGHLEALELLLAPARELGFTVPVEAAVHLHWDANPFRDPAALRQLVRLFARREELWAAMDTNPRCRRLAPLPPALVELVEQDLSWPDLAEQARKVGLTKYADLNLTQLVSTRPLRHTVEVRVLPGAIHGADIVRRAALLEGQL